MKAASPGESSGIHDEIKNKQILMDGFVFLKYGKWGEPGYRTVRVTSDFKNIEWIHHGQAKASNFMPLSTLIGIKFGRHTPNFKKIKSTKLEQEELSFSIIGEKRNLDLEASLKEQKEQFVEGIVSLMGWYKKNHAKTKK